jgi:1-acyl-sn-glycerol-3-phosphate acyltransferase
LVIFATVAVKRSSPNTISDLGAGIFRRFFYLVSLPVKIIVILYPSFLLIGLGCLILIPFDRAGVTQRRLAQTALKLHSWLTGMRFTVSFKTALDPGKCYLVVARFRSIIDIVAIIATFPTANVVAIIRRHNFFIPVLGWCLIGARYICFDRRRPFKVLNDIALAVAQCKVSVIYFPNGHQNDIRSAEGLPKNYLKVAQRSQLDILPVVLTFSDDAFQVAYDTPIAAQEFNRADHDALNARIFEQITQRNPQVTLGQP